MGRISRTHLALAVVLVVASTGTDVAAQDDWQSAYSIGDPVELKIDEGIWQTCVVSENPPGGLMRVMCEEIDIPGTYQRVGGRYIVGGERDLRPAGSAAAAPVVAAPPAPVPAASPAARPPTVATRPATKPADSKPAKEAQSAPRTTPALPTLPAPASGGLPVGEYACYGNGGQILAGLGFKVVGNGRYTDLEGGNAGSFAVNGETVTFRGGHLDGQIGRALNRGSFQIGGAASCEPW